MCIKDLTNEVRIFINKYLESTQQLEILLLLFNKQSILFTPQDVAFELRTNNFSSELCLKKLYENGLIIKIGDSYQFCNSDLDIKVRLLNKAYQEYKYSVINYIYSKPMENIFSFADAFKISDSDYLLPLRRKKHDLNNC